MKETELELGLYACKEACLITSVTTATLLDKYLLGEKTLDTSVITE